MSFKSSEVFGQCVKEKHHASTVFRECKKRKIDVFLYFGHFETITICMDGGDLYLGHFETMKKGCGGAFCT